MPTDCASAMRDYNVTSTPQTCKGEEQTVTCVVKNQTKPVYMCGPKGGETTQFCHPPASTNRTTNMPASKQW